MVTLFPRVFYCWICANLSKRFRIVFMVGANCKCTRSKSKHTFVQFIHFCSYSYSSLIYKWMTHQIMQGQMFDYGIVWYGERAVSTFQKQFNFLLNHLCGLSWSHLTLNTLKREQLPNRAVATLWNGVDVGLPLEWLFCVLRTVLPCRRNGFSNRCFWNNCAKYTPSLP